MFLPRARTTSVGVPIVCVALLAGSLHGQVEPRTTSSHAIPRLEYYQNFLPARQRNFYDVNGDGIEDILEVIDGQVHVYDIVNHAPLPFGNWPRPIGGADGDQPLQAPAVGEVIATNPGLEVVTVTGPQSQDMHLNIFSSDGTLLFTMQTPEVEPHSFALADLDDDGDQEIVVGALARIDFKWWTKVFAFQGNGTPVAGQWPVKLERAGQDSTVGLCVGDFEGDGDVEIVYGAVVSCLVGACWEPIPSSVIGLEHDGSEVFNYPLPADEGGVQRPALADLDGDGLLEVIFTTRYAGNSFLHVVQVNGQEQMPRMDAGYFAYPPVIGDLDGDGELEIVVPDHGNDIIWVRDHHGHVVSTIDYGGDLTLADVDQDGIVEIIVGSRLNPGMRINAVNYLDGTQPRGWPVITSLPMNNYNDPDNAYGVIGNLDVDSRIEVMLGNTLIELPVEMGSRGFEWPRYRCDAMHRGCYSSP